MRVIGIDPGTVCCGYGIVEVDAKRSTAGGQAAYVASGEIRMSRKDALPVRLKTLYHSLRAVFQEYSPSHACIEKVFYHKSIRSAFALGSTRGIVMLLAADCGIPVFEYNPTAMKMALTGYGRAEKRQVKDMVVRVLNINPLAQHLTEDITDALALCICHINSANKLK